MKMLLFNVIISLTCKIIIIIISFFFYSEQLNSYSGIVVIVFIETSIKYIEWKAKSE